MPKDNTWKIELKNFQAGLSPLAFTSVLTEVGGEGHSSYMKNVDCLDGRLTQGLGLTDLTAGTQAGAVDQLISFIMDEAVASNSSYAIGTTKLFQISSTAVANAGIWPHAVTGMADGKSIAYLQGNLYYFFNKASGGDIGKYDLTTTFTDGWGSSEDAALEKAPHPVDTKEDIMVFGNGQYVGTYIGNSDTLTVQKLDFGTGSEVADLLFGNNQWYLAVNSGTTGRMKGQIYLWDAGALVATLADETGVGVQEIGFIMLINGVVWMAYRDETESGFIIGYISGRQIVPMGRYTGTLPTYQQKTLYRGTIMFLSSALVWSAGAIVNEFPFQLSQIGDGGHATVGGIGSPFGTPLVASSYTTSFKLSKLTGFLVDAEWHSILFSLVGGLNKGFIDSVTVLTKVLGANARCDLIVLANQAVNAGATLQIKGTGITRHHFTNVGLGGIEDFKIKLDWSNGNATNDCLIRKIIIKGHWSES